MGCLKLSYYQEGEALENFEKNLKVAYAKRGFSEKKGLNYSTFGSLMPGRNASSGDYRYGFNGMEKDDEVKGSTGSSYDFGARMYDPRLGRWLSVDPLYKKYPFASPYQFAADNPIYWIDFDGRDLYGANSADRQIVNQSVALVLGDDQSVFKFNENKLEFNDSYDPSQFSADQNKFIKEFNNTIVSNTDIKVHIHHTDKGVNVGDGDEITLNKIEPEYTIESAPGVVDLYVNPKESANRGTIFEGLNKEGKAKAKELTKEQKSEIEKKDGSKISFLHGIGHALQFAKGNNKASDDKKAVGFENFVRKIVGLPERTGNNHGVNQNSKGSDPDF